MQYIKKRCKDFLAVRTLLIRMARRYCPGTGLGLPTLVFQETYFERGDKVKISKGRRRNSIGLYQGVDNSERAIVQLLDGETDSIPQAFLVKLNPSGNLNWCIYFFSLLPSLFYVTGAPKVKLTDLDDNDVEVEVRDLPDFNEMAKGRLVPNQAAEDQREEIKPNQQNRTSTEVVDISIQ